MCTGGNKVALFAISVVSFGAVRNCKNRDEFINYTVRVSLSVFTKVSLMQSVLAF